MRSWSVLSTFALAGALAASTAYAGGTSARAEAPYDRSVFPYGDALTVSDMRDMAALCCLPSEPAVEPGASIEGTVAAVDRQSGQLVLDTDEGLVSLTTWPVEVSAVQPGDVVRVSFLDIETSD